MSICLDVSWTEVHVTDSCVHLEPYGCYCSSIAYNVTNISQYGVSTSNNTYLKLIRWLVSVSVSVSTLVAAGVTQHIGPMVQMIIDS